MNFKFFAGMLGIVVVMVLQGCSKECKIKTLSQITSPNGERKVVIRKSQCDGFSPADSSVSDSVYINSKVLTGNQEFIVFSTNADSDKSGIVAKWLSNNRLEISVAKNSDIQTWLTQYEDIEVVVKLIERN